MTASPVSADFLERTSQGYLCTACPRMVRKGVLRHAYADATHVQTSSRLWHLTEDHDALWQSTKNALILLRPHTFRDAPNYVQGCDRNRILTVAEQIAKASEYAKAARENVKREFRQA